MLGRRKFLGMLGVGAAAAPLAGQQLLRESTIGQVSMHDWRGAPAGPAPVSTFQDMAKRAFASKETLEAARSMLFEEQRDVGAIDHDLASKRSFSLAAKVTFQRQRNVGRQIEQMQANSVHGRLHDLIAKPFKVFG